MQKEIELSVVLPCLNEIETLAICIDKAKNCMERLKVIGEVIVADNGSTDGSPAVAKNCGARVIHVKEKGYGSALKGGINAANGKFVIMGDADDSYSLDKLDSFIHALRDGNDLVMGNRFRGKIEKGAMPFLHKWLGNPVLSFLGRLFFKSDIKDFHCGLRGFNKNKIIQLNLQTTGMEFASELVVKSLLANYKVAEVPTDLKIDGRSRPPHLRTWRDGWRHLRFLLSYSPRWLFLYPGNALLILGFCFTLLLAKADVSIGQVTFSSQTLIMSTFLMQFGVQLIWLSILSKASSTVRGFLPIDLKWVNLLRKIQRESNYLIYLALILLGLGILVHQIQNWAKLSFGNLAPREAVTGAVIGVLLLSTGVQSLVSQFLLNIVTLNWNPFAEVDTKLRSNSPD